MAADKDSLAPARAAVKIVALVVGFPTVVVCLMALVGRFAESGWVRAIVALLAAIVVPAVISDRLLPDDDPSKAKGLVGDVFAATWLALVLVIVVAAGPVTRPLLVTEGDRLTSGGLGAAGKLAYLLAGVRATDTPALPEAAPSGSAPAASSAPVAAAPPESALPPASAEAPPAKRPKESGDLSPAELFKQLAPAVVSIGIKAMDQEVGGGTGFLIDEQGTIVTNHHVIAPAQALRVKFMNGAVYEEVDLLYDDAALDLALLRIDIRKPKSGDRPKDLQPVKLGDSDSVQVGERAISIGNPLGLDHTLTDGLVSARRVYEGRQWIQMSVPVSPGNSGGPLFDMKGLVIGVTTAQVGSFFGRAQNLNLAIPVNTVKQQIKPNYPGRRKFGDGAKSSHW